MTKKRKQINKNICNKFLLIINCDLNIYYLTRYILYNNACNMRCIRVCRNDAYDFLIIFVLGKKQYINQEKQYQLYITCPVYNN